jgi:hypothetical protein
MSRVTPPTNQSIDREVAKLQADRARRMALALTSIVAFAAAFIGIAYLMLSDQSPNSETSAPPITAEDLAPIAED